MKEFKVKTGCTIVEGIPTDIKNLKLAIFKEKVICVSEDYPPFIIRAGKAEKISWKSMFEDNI